MTTQCLTLKKSNCRNCHKCIRHCPVKAIRFSGEQAHIIKEECILCGTCFVVCPQGAKEIVSEIEKVRVLMQSGAPVVASLAPSFIANYDGAGIEAMREALRKIGFHDVEETAIGATMVANDFDRIVNEGTQSVVISSCCHSVNLLIQTYYPDLIPCLAQTMSPMQAHCLDIKRRMPEARTVFIGPCVAKKDESHKYQGIVDAALTFEELRQMLDEAGVEIEHVMDANECSKARLFPTAGGVLKTMKKNNPDYDYFAIDGVPNCIAALNDIREGNIEHCFIEMNACPGACVNGPVMEKYHYNVVKDYLAVARYAGDKDFPVVQPDPAAITKLYPSLAEVRNLPTEYEIREILKQMGKTTPEDELNCGTCGYESCREKAIAVYQGKAQIEMCLPYLRDRSENFSNIIFDNTPNGLLVLNDRFEIQMINPAACKMMNIRRAKDVLGEQVVTVLDPKPFFDAARSKRGVYLTSYLADYDRYVDQTVLYDENYHMYFCLLQDITERTMEKAKRQNARKQTVEVADEVVERQMRIVQEIASLLGETAAETKIALTQLKESIEDE
ncbi:MAG: 4Fe-4S binding protein [Mogibacterium sp.]|nr:4Fe-4S binding protein [Mogibacterium sp.]